MYPPLYKTPPPLKWVEKRGVRNRRNPPPSWITPDKRVLLLSFIHIFKQSINFNLYKCLHIAYNDYQKFQGVWSRIGELFRGEGVVRSVGGECLSKACRHLTSVHLSRVHMWSLLAFPPFLRTIFLQTLNSFYPFSYKRFILRVFRFHFYRCSEIFPN